MLRILFVCLLLVLVIPTDVSATMETQLQHFEQQIVQFRSAWEETRQLQQKQKSLGRKVAEQKTEEGFGPANPELNRQLLSLRRLSGELRSRRKQLKQIREDLRSENQRLKEMAEGLTNPDERQAVKQQLRKLNRRYRQEIEKQRPDPLKQAERLLQQMDRQLPPRRSRMLRERAREVLRVMEKRLEMMDDRGDNGPRRKRLDSLHQQLLERLTPENPAGNPAPPPENGQSGE